MGYCKNIILLKNNQKYLTGFVVLDFLAGGIGSKSGLEVSDVPSDEPSDESSGVLLSSDPSLSCKRLFLDGALTKASSSVSLRGDVSL